MKMIICIIMSWYFKKEILDTTSAPIKLRQVNWRKIVKERPRNDKKKKEKKKKKKKKKKIYKKKIKKKKNFFFFLRHTFVMSRDMWLWHRSAAPPTWHTFQTCQNHKTSYRYL